MKKEDNDVKMDDDAIRIGGIGPRFPLSCLLQKSYIRD